MDPYADKFARLKLKSEARSDVDEYLLDRDLEDFEQKKKAYEVEIEDLKLEHQFEKEVLTTYLIGEMNELKKQLTAKENQLKRVYKIGGSAIMTLIGIILCQAIGNNKKPKAPK